MPDYVFLLYGTPDDWTVGGPEWDEGLRRHEEFGKAIAAAGATVVGGAALHPPRAARTVRGADRTVHDGPFAETREVLGGFYVIRADDMDTALALARVCPEDVVEVREQVG